MTPDMKARELIGLLASYGETVEVDVAIEHVRAYLAAPSPHPDEETVSARVVLAALDDILEPMTMHKGTHLSIMRGRVQALRSHVAQYVRPTPEGSTDA